MKRFSPRRDPAARSPVLVLEVSAVPSGGLMANLIFPRDKHKFDAININSMRSDA